MVLSPTKEWLPQQNHSIFRAMQQIPLDISAFYPACRLPPPSTCHLPATYLLPTTHPALCGVFCAHVLRGECEHLTHEAQAVRETSFQTEKTPALVGVARGHEKPSSLGRFMANVLSTLRLGELMAKDKAKELLEKLGMKVDEVSDELEEKITEWKSTFCEQGCCAIPVAYGAVGAIIERCIQAQGRPQEAARMPLSIPSLTHGEFSAACR